MDNQNWKTVMSGKRKVVSLIPFYDDQQTKASWGLYYKGEVQGDFPGMIYKAALSSGLTGVLNYFGSLGINNAYCRINSDEALRAKSIFGMFKKMKFIEILLDAEKIFTPQNLVLIAEHMRKMSIEPHDCVYLFNDRVTINIGGTFHYQIELQMVTK